MSKFYCTFILLIIFPFVANSQTHPFKYEHITEQNGLSHSCISCIIQDSKGFIWIGTENGLNKYDRYTMKEYIHEPGNPHSLSSNFIRALYQQPVDSGKVLWIGTIGGGLNKFDLELEKFTIYRHVPDDLTSLSHNDVQCIYKDRAGTMWIGTEGGGLNGFDRETGKFISYRHDSNDSNSISDNWIYAICEDQYGDLWLGHSRYGGLTKFDRQKGIFYHYNPTTTLNVI